MLRYWRVAGIMLLLTWLPIPVVWGDWLDISGEKGFSFSFNENKATNFGLNQGFGFSQSLTLDLKGGFGEDYWVDGHLIDQSDTPLQLFLALKGKQFGLQFGDGDLKSFSTPLTRWNGEFNGLDAYFQNQRHRIKATYANPTGIAVQESLAVPAGRNYGYLAYRPVKAESLTVVCNGKVLAEGIDYTVDYLSGELKLLFFVAHATRLDLSYQYLPDSVLGNQFLALQEQSNWGPYRLGVDYFAARSPRQEVSLLLGEHKALPDLDLLGLNGGLDLTNWRWDLEYWISQERVGEAHWDYLDSMDGRAVETEAFAGSTVPAQWSVWGSGSGYLTISEVRADQELEHTRENQPSLGLEYQLQRSGDRVGIYHDFGTYRDFSKYSRLSYWVYLNGQNLELELAVITSENNYYARKVMVRDFGWQRFDLELDPDKLERVGLADLRKIRYLKFSLSSPGGAGLTGQLYLAPLRVVEQSLAAQRWSIRESAPGSSITVRSVAEAVPGQSGDNQVLQLDYLVPEGGWAQVSYQPALAVDLSRYRALKLALNTPGAVEVGLLVTRAGTKYPIGQFQVATGGAWQEFTLDLTGLSPYSLAKIESFTLKLTAASGLGQLKVDAIRVVDRMSGPSAALKGRGEYWSGPWHNLFELNRFEAGFRGVDAVYPLASRTVRNFTEFTDEVWRVKSDLQFYDQADLISGYPVAGRKLALEVQHKDTAVTLGLTGDEASAADGLTGGTRAESRLGLAHQAGAWNFDYQKYRTEDTLGGTVVRQSDALQVKFERNYWSGWTRVWQDQATSGGLASRQSGNNLGLRFDPPGVNRLQLMGGAVASTAGLTTTTRNYWQSEMALELSNWLTVNGKYQFEDQLETTAGIINDRLAGLEFGLVPVAGMNLKLNLETRIWEEVASGGFAQEIQECYLDYYQSDQAKLGLFYRLEELAAALGTNTTGYRAGVNGAVVLKAPWLTQFTTEFNQSDSRDGFSGGRQGAWQSSVKNIRQSGPVSYYWGAWAESIRQSGELPEWERHLAQWGLEYRTPGHWKLGVKFDLGYEMATRSPKQPPGGLVWGAGSFVTFEDQQNYFQFDLRYQTFTNTRWTVGLDYRIFKGNSYTFNWQNHYLLDLSTGRDLVSRLDLRFYFH